MKPLLHLLTLFRPFWGWAVLGIVLSMTTMLANITLLATSAWFITAMGVAGLAGVSMNYFTPAAIIRGCAIARTAGRYVERLVTHEATFRFLTELRVRIFRDFVAAPVDKIERVHSTDLSSRIQYDIESLQGFYVRVIVPVAASLFTALLCILYLCRYDISLVLVIASGLIAAGLIVPVLAYRTVAKNANEMFLTAEALKEQSVDMLDGLGDLIVFNGLKDAQSAFLQNISRRIAVIAVDDTVALLSKNILWLVAQLTFLATVVLAADLLHTQRLIQADFVMLSMFAVACFESVAQVAPALMQIPQNRAASDRVFAFQTTDNTNAAAHVTKIPQNVDLDVKDVQFAFHAGQSKPLRFAFRLPPGRTLLLRGPSGIGKSTLIDLLVAQRTPQSGEIKLNGYPLHAYAADTLMHIFSVSPQTTQIFSGSLLENLTLGCPDYTLDAIQKALKTCELQSLIAQLPNGLNTYIGEQGYNLSGGQIRRLGVARALLKPSPILILDEPTEGLDPETASRMMKMLITNLNGRSLIIISHHHIDECLDTLDLVQD